MTLKKLIRIYYWVSFMLAAALAFTAIMAYITHNRLVRSQQLRVESYLLADELRQSSDDLTRFARTYVITGDPKYDQFYHDALAIRNGTKPRPEKYQFIYWDFVVDQGRPLHAGTTRAVSLRQLMAELGFTQVEFAKLAEAEDNSNKLVKIEETAMNAVKGRFADKDGKFTRRGTPDTTLATRLMYDEIYHHEKARVMKPIAEFLELMNARTMAELTLQQRRNTLYLRLILALLVLLVLLKSALYVLFRTVVRKPVDALQQQTRAVAADMDRLAGVVKEISKGGAGRSFAVEAQRLGSKSASEVGELARLHDGMIDRLQEMGAAVTAIISELSRSQVEMRKLWRSVEASPASIVITDKNGNIEYANPKFTDLTGYTLEEAMGKNPRILKGDTPPSVYKELWAELKAGREWRGQFHNRKKNGEFFWEAASISPVKDAAGNIANFVAVKEDITESIMARKAVEAARDAAVALARMKAEFLANMSHEIRTPMNAIIGMTGLLQDTQLDPQQREYVTTVNNAGEALLDIINDILDFSKIESGMMTIEKTGLSVADVVESTMEIVAPRARGKGVELAFLTDQDVPAALTGDPARLRQVLMNLLSNAVKFTERGEVLLTAKMQGEDKGRVIVRFSVKDTGIGISKEAQKNLFQSFSQADASTTRKYGGTGLGLAISKKLVELMGGNIGLDSEPGKGSDFWFTLPFERSAAAAVAEPSRASLHEARALIVDDNEVSRKIIAHHLSSWKMRFEAAASGQAALELLEKEAAGNDPFTLLVLDMQMPGMDGLMLAGSIQKIPACAGLRKVMLTSLGMPLKPEDAVALGISACLTKPVRPAMLFEALCKAMGGAAPVKVRPAAETPAPVKTARRNFRILLAEDNLVNQKVTLMQLYKAGYKADVAANGLQALAAMKKNSYDLVLMDCQMPEMDGFQATAEIRKAEGGKWHTPVVAMTANAMEGDREKCLAAGMDDYIPKPVRLEALVKAIGKWDMDLDAEAVEAIKGAAGEDMEFFSGLVDVYRKDGEIRLGEIREALAAGDAKALTAAAHAFKGASGNMGAVRVAAICRRLEFMGRAGTTEGAAEQLAMLTEEFATAMAALEAERAKKPGA